MNELKPTEPTEAEKRDHAERNEQQIEIFKAYLARKEENRKQQENELEH